MGRLRIGRRRRPAGRQGWRMACSDSAGATLARCSNAAVTLFGTKSLDPGVRPARLSPLTNGRPFPGIRSHFLPDLRMMKEGGIREDLYHRLNVVHFRVPHARSVIQNRGLGRSASRSAKLPHR